MPSYDRCDKQDSYMKDKISLSSEILEYTLSSVSQRILLKEI